MQRNDLSYLGDGVSLLTFFLFNACIFGAWAALQILSLFASVGVDYIFTIDPQPVFTSMLGQLGYAFVNLLYGLSIFILSAIIVAAWVYGNIYLLRKELYNFAKWLFRWGDL